MVTTRDWNVVTVGFDFDLIDGLFSRLERRGGVRFSHVLDPRYDKRTLASSGRTGPFFTIREDIRDVLPDADLMLLSSLEHPSVPTVHNMIMGDRILRGVRYEDALRYASLLTKRLCGLFEELKPALVLGGIDGFHASAALAVARKVGIQFSCLNFSTLPPGYACWCEGMSPNSRMDIQLNGPDELRELAESALKGFENRAIAVPRFHSDHTLRDILVKLPSRLERFLDVARQSVVGGIDRFTEYSLKGMVKDFLRKRLNLVRLPLADMLAVPPASRYFFFGLHMQPESSIDVWAPFHSNQAVVIETIARAMPVDCCLLVKLHMSDADNYSPRQLKALAQLPGVSLVSPFVDSRPFIEGASMVFGIQGTLGLEAALLGKPVIMFGDSPVCLFPSAFRAVEPSGLAEQIRRMLAVPPPSRGQIIEAYCEYLSPMMEACHNDWSVSISDEAIAGFARMFEVLREHLSRRPITACVG